MEVEFINLKHFYDFISRYVEEKHSNLERYINDLVLTAYRGQKVYRLKSVETKTRQEESIYFQCSVKYDEDTDTDLITIVF